MYFGYIILRPARNELVLYQSAKRQFLNFSWHTDKCKNNKQNTGWPRFTWVWLPVYASLFSMDSVMILCKEDAIEVLRS